MRCSPPRISRSPCATIVASEPGRQVGTVGRIEVTPNAQNVIPGVVRLTIELRDLSPEKLKGLADRIRLRAADIARETKTSIEFTSSSHNTTGECSFRGAAGDRTERRRLGLREPADAERRGARRADDGAALANGHDLRAERRAASATRRSS